MVFRLHIKPKARKNLDRIPERDRIKITLVLDVIVKEPFYGKKLLGNREGQWSVQVWPYRIIYVIEKKELVVVVIDIDHSGSVYQK